MTVAPAAGQGGRGSGGVADPERDPDVPGGAMSHLDIVDVCRVRRIGQLERGAARLQDRHPAAGRGIRRALGQAQHVTVEPQRLLVVRCGHHQPQLRHLRLAGHRAPIW
jgi:hypothetical protein